MFDQNLIVCLDGEFIKPKDLKILSLTYSIHYGLKVFERIKAYKIKNNLEIFDNTREKDVLKNKNIETEKKEINSDFIKNIY